MSGIIMAFVGMVAYPAAKAQNNEIEEVKKVIVQFALAGDYQDVAIMEEVLDPNFRVVMNRLFGADGVAVMDREAYVNKIRNKEFGGESREVTVSNVIINGYTASALVTFKGSKLTFVSTLSLVLNSNGKWKLIGDLPHVI